MCLVPIIASFILCYYSCIKWIRQSPQKTIRFPVHSWHKRAPIKRNKRHVRTTFIQGSCYTFLRIFHVNRDTPQINWGFYLHDQEIFGIFWQNLAIFTNLYFFCVAWILRLKRQPVFKIFLSLGCFILTSDSLWGHEKTAGLVAEGNQK